MQYGRGGGLALINTPDDAEHFAAQHVRALGFVDASANPGGPDGGIDVRSDQAVAQVKLHSKPCGRPDLQRLYGARGIDHSKQMVFYSHNGYSAAAIAYADSVGMTLYQFDVLGNAVLVNGVSSRGSGGGRDADPELLSGLDSAEGLTEHRKQLLWAQIDRKYEQRQRMLREFRAELDGMPTREAAKHIQQLQLDMGPDEYTKFRKEYFKSRRSRERRAALPGTETQRALVLAIAFSVACPALIIPMSFKGHFFDSLVLLIFPLMFWAIYFLSKKSENEGP